MNDFDDVISAASEQYQLPAALLKGLIRQESNFDPQARSDRGAFGLAQFMPETAKEVGIDPADPIQSIFGAAFYLKKQIDKFGSIDKGLAAYNWGQGNLRKAVDAYGDDWANKAPSETQKYISSIADHVATYDGDFKKNVVVDPSAPTPPAAVSPLDHGAMGRTTKMVDEGPDRTWIEFGKDSVKDLVQGTGQLASGVAWLARKGVVDPIGRAVEGDDYKPNTDLEDAMKGTDELIAEGKSDKARWQQDQIKKLNDDPELRSGFLDTMEFLIKNPTAAVSSMLQSAPGTVATGMIGGKVATAVADRVMGKALSLGPITAEASLAAKELATKAAERGAGWAAGSTEALQSFAQIGQSIEQKMDAAGITDPEQRAAGLRLAIPAALATLLGGRLVGGGTEARLFANKTLTRVGETAVGATLKGTGREALEEGVQTLGEQTFQNLGEAEGTRTNDPLSKGVGAGVAMGMAVGGLQGGGSTVVGRAMDRLTDPTTPVKAADAVMAAADLGEATRAVKAILEQTSVTGNNTSTYDPSFDTTAIIPEDGLDEQQRTINEALSKTLGPDGTATLNGVPVRAIPEASMPDAGTPEGDGRVTADGARALRSLFDAVGTKVIFYEDDGKLSDGFAHPLAPDTIFLSNNPQRAANFVARHELKHTLETTSAPDGRSYGDILLDMAGVGITEEGMRQTRRFTSTAPEGGSAAQLKSHYLNELLADTFADVSKTKSFMGRTFDYVKAKYGQNVAVDFLSKMVDSFDAAFAKVQALFGGSSIVESKAWFKNADEIHGVMAQMLGDKLGQTAVARSQKTAPAATPTKTWTAEREGEINELQAKAREMGKNLTDDNIAEYDALVNRAEDLMDERAAITGKPRYSPKTKVTREDWKQAQEYEGRLFGGAYGWSRVEGPKGGSSAKDAPMRKIIMLARDRYNDLREKFGLEKITNWQERPSREQLVQFTPDPGELKQSPKEIDAAAHEAATSPLNDRPEPTAAQKEAGNYKVGKIEIQGLPISIENPVGSVRSGVSPDGKKWSNTMKSHYGYLRGSVGKDKDHIDVFVGKNPMSEKVFVVDQKNKSGGFDEHKVLLGFNNADAARVGYMENYAKGWNGLGKLTATTVGEFKRWLADGDTTKPFGNNGQFDASNPDIRYSPKLKPEIAETLGPYVKGLKPEEALKFRRDTAQTFRDIITTLPSADEIAAVAYAGRAKRGWYAHSAEAMVHVFGADAPRFAALLAAMSPQTSVEMNLFNTAGTWRGWVAAGKPTDRDKIIRIMGQNVQGNNLTDSVLGAWINNSVRALTSENPGKLVISGPKVNSFFNNLIGITDEVTNDAWMANFALVDQRLFKGNLSKDQTDPGKTPGYLAMSAQVRLAARRLTKLTGETWTPAEVQETVWSWAKTLYEQANAKDSIDRAVDIINNGELSNELIKSTPDFRTLFHDEPIDKALRAAGHGRELDSLRDRSDISWASDEGPATGSQTAPFAREAQLAHERRGAKRLDKLAAQRAANKAETIAARDEDIQFSPKVNFEVAPDPNNKKAVERWNSLSEAQKYAISDRVARRVIPTYLDTVGADGDLSPQIGSYLGDTNPSFILTVTKGDPLQIAKDLGYALSQDSMMVVSDKPLAGGEMHGAVTIELGPKTPAEIAEIYATLRAARPGENNPISGQSYSDGYMTVLNYSDLSTDALAEIIGNALGNKYNVLSHEVYASLIEKENYGYDTQGNTGRDSEAVRFREGTVRRRVAEAIGDEFARSGGQYSPRDDGRSYGAGNTEFGSGRAGAVQARKPGEVSGTGVHYSTAERKALTASYFGTGYKGAELARVRESTDPRIQQRIYFYVNDGRGISRESGVGPYAHKAQLSNIYDAGADTLDLWPGRTPNEFESAVLDAGFDGYTVPGRGAAVLLGPRTVKVESLGMGVTPEVDRMERADKSPRGKLQQMLAENKLLPAGEVMGEMWKRMLPELDLSHLSDNEKYYKDQLLKFSPKTPIFYSQMARVIDQLMGKAEPAKELAAKVDAWARAGKYKSDELQWSGLKDWLALQDGKVTKQQVADFLANDGVQVTETVLGEADRLITDRLPDGWTLRELEPNEDVRYEVLDAEGMQRGLGDTLEEAMEDANTAVDYTNQVAGTKYSNWQLPGGEDYRELLLTLPQSLAGADVRQLSDGSWRVTSPTGSASFGDTREKAVERYTSQQGGVSGFKSSHFDQPNILAHVRLNERTDADGNRVLFLEELQSDWGASNRRALKEITKPDAIGELANNVLGRKMASVMPLNKMDGGVLAALHNDQVRRAIVADLPVDVVNYLSTKQLSSKDFFSDPDVVVTRLAPDHLSSVTNGFLGAMRSVGTSLRAKLLDAYSAGRDENILGTLKASDLSARKVVGLLSPERIYHDRLLGDTSGGNVAPSAAEISGRSSDVARGSAEGDSAIVARGETSGIGASSRTETTPRSARSNGEKFSASLASIVDWHNKIVQKTGDSLQDKYIGAPFVGDTYGYTTLAFKRMLRYAAENNFDKIAWTTGEQQAARYDLSKQVSRITYQVVGDGNYKVRVFDKNNDAIQNIPPTLDADGIENYVGKDIAKQIVENATSDLKAISGEGLKIGGEGMIGYYDKILPAEINKYVKKWGVKVDSTDIQLDSSQRTLAFFLDFMEENHPSIPRSVAAEKWKLGEKAEWVREFLASRTDSQQPSLTITPEMKTSVLEGQPLFSPKFNPNISFPGETRVEAVQRTIQDKFNRFKVLREWALANGANLTEGSDVYMMEAISYGRRATRVEDFREQVFKPIVKEIHRAGLSLPQVSDYLHAMHAEERNKAVAKINPKMASGSGMDTAAAKAIIAKASPELKAVAAKIQAITRDTLDIKLAAQLISQETYDTLTDAYQNYVPLKGGDEVVMTGTGKGFDINHKMRRALGHTFREEAIIENILRDHETAIALAEKQRVGLSLAQLAIELGDRDVLTVGQPEKRAVLKAGDVRYEVRYDGGTVDVLHNLQDARAAMQNYMAQSGDPKKWAVVKLAAPERVAYEASSMLQENEARFYINGEPIRIQINDPVLAQAYKNMGVDHLVGVLKIGKEVNAWLSRAYTGYNPEFVFVNMMRDFTEGVINLTGDYGAGTMAKVIANYPKSLATLARYAATGKATKDISDYRADGGSTGAAYLSDLERIGEDVKRAYNDYAGVMDTARRDGTFAAARVAGDKTIRTLAHYIEVANQAAENAMRLATYTALRDEGKSRNVAALAAKDVTLNFNRKGEIGAQAGALYLFFNPAMQGATRSLQTLFYSEHRAQAWALAGSIGVLGFAMAALNADLDPDKWDKTPNYVKGHNLVVPVGSKQLTIPVPYGYGFFLSMGTVLNNIMRGKDKKDSLWLLANAFAESYSPVGNPVGDKPDATGLVQVLPTMARIPMEIVTNRSGLGSPIYPKDDERRPGRPDSSNMFRNTKGTGWDMAAGGINKLTGGNIAQKGWVDVHPDVLKSLWSTATGGTGRFMTDTLQLGNLVARGATPDLREIPIVRKFVREENVGDARREFWDAVEEVRKFSDEAATAKAMQKQAYKTGNMEMAKEAEMVRSQLAAEQGAMLSLGKMITSYTKQVSLKRERADIVMADNSLSLAQRREQVKMIEAEEKEIYDRFMALFRERKKASR